MLDVRVDKNIQLTDASSSFSDRLLSFISAASVYECVAVCVHICLCGEVGEGEGMQKEVPIMRQACDNDIREPQFS